VIKLVVFLKEIGVFTVKNREAGYYDVCMGLDQRTA
jgi:hypothetical protein